jgi:hypothetical protein
MCLPSELDAALALLEMANGHGYLEQDLATNNHCEEEAVDLVVRASTSSSEHSWAHMMEESDSELGYIWPSGATEPEVPKRVLPAKHSHPPSSPSPLSKEWTVSPQLDAAETFETSMQTYWRSWGDVQYKVDSLFLDPRHSDRLEDHEITKPVATGKSHCFDVRKGISQSTTLHQLVLLRCAMRKSRGQSYIPNSHNDKDGHANFQKRITEHIRYHLRQPFYIC